MTTPAAYRTKDAAGVLLIGALLLASCGGTGGGSWKGHGEVAYVANGQLSVLDNAGTRHAVVGPGLASMPTWSADGNWVAYLRAPRPPASQPYATPSSRLWVARVDGSDAHPLTDPNLDVTEFAWSPAAGADTLVVTTTNPPDQSTTAVSVMTPTSADVRRLLTTEGATSFAWDRSGKDLAVTTTNPPSGSRTFTGVAEILPVGGGSPYAVFSSSGNVLEIGGWWPNGGGLLLWEDPQGSTSIAADGIPLDSLDLSNGRVTTLATTLTYPNWYAWSPNGTTLAVTAGGDRSVWDPTRQLELCAVPLQSCTPVAQPARQISLDPTWTASGAVVFVRAPAATAADPFGAPPVLGNSEAPYDAKTLRAWYDDQQLWTSPPTGAGTRRLPGIPTGAHDPKAAGGGLVYVLRGGLWYQPADDRTPFEIASAVGGDAAYGNDYYGYVNWAAYYAWHT